MMDKIRKYLMYFLEVFTRLLTWTLIKMEVWLKLLQQDTQEAIGKVSNLKLLNTRN
jgi:hypothetical protein